MVKQILKMKLLALDTSTEACSAALYLDGQLMEQYRLAPREHSQLILDMIQHLLAESGLVLSQLDGLAFGRGPGSFVGVRIATGIAQGIAYAADLPVVPVSSLEALAYGSGHDYTAVAIDARMQEVYWAHYIRQSTGEMKLAAGEGVCAPERVPQCHKEHSWIGVGSGWLGHHERLSHRLGVKQWEGEVYPRAASIVRLALAKLNRGQSVSADQAMPTYLRDRVAKPPEQKI